MLVYNYNYIMQKKDSQTSSSLDSKNSQNSTRPSRSVPRKQSLI